MQWLMRFTFIVWLIHFYVFDSSMIDQRPLIFLALPVIALTLMASFGLVVSITKTALQANASQYEKLAFQPIAQSAFFVAILLISLFSADQTRQALNQKIDRLNDKTSLSLHPSILAKLNSAKSEEQGRLFARMIYHSHSIVLPYQLNGEAVFFTPADQDKKAAKTNRQNLINNGKTLNALRMKQKQLSQLFYAQLILTFIVICLTLGLVQLNKITLLK